MGQLVFQANSGGQTNLVGQNTASTFNLNIPLANGTLVSTGDTATVTSAMISGPVTTAKGGTGLTSFSSGGAVYATSTSALTTGTLPTSAGGTNLTSFTANGVVYASSTSALTTGSALVFDGTNLGLGGTPSAWGSGFNTFDVGSYGSFYYSGGFVGVSANGYYNSNWKYKNTAAASKYEQNSGTHAWYNAPSGTAGNAITFTQAMTLTANGSWLLGTTTVGVSNTKSILADLGGDGYLIVNHSGSASGSGYQYFGYNGNIIGSITQSGTTAVLYNVTSDQRLKTDLGAVTNTNVIANTVIHDFTWKSDGSQARGVFAQEAAKVLPIAVKIGDDGEEVTDQWQVDYSKYVPDIIVELQSLRARVAQLESLKG